MANATTLEKRLEKTPGTMDKDARDAPAEDAPAGAAKPGPYQEHWASVVGAFKDDPMLDEMMENIRRRRREMDADDSIP